MFPPRVDAEYPAAGRVSSSRFRGRGLPDWNRCAGGAARPPATVRHGSAVPWPKVRLAVSIVCLPVDPTTTGSIGDGAVKLSEELRVMRGASSRPVERCLLDALPLAALCVGDS